jgi:sigma-B regulation protein RsbU (phosphoserine phosphatase)
MGHGVRAALVTAIVRGLVEELREAAGDPGLFVTEMNRSLCAILHQTTTPLFATAVYVVVDAARGVVRWANAGHPAPFHLRRTLGTVERLQQLATRPGPALGVVPTAAYSTLERALHPGDLLMLFTDGLYELDGPDDALYEMSQLTEAVLARCAMDTPRLFDDLISELRHYSVTGEFGDDMCLVGVDITRLLPAEPPDA